MARSDPTEVRRIACIGAGTIGGGWAAEFLRSGCDVVAWDPAADGETRLREYVDAAWQALEALGLADGASPNRLSYAASLAGAVAEAEFVQESAPEQMDVKIEVIAEIDAATPTDVVISSSTSGFSMSDMQVKCRHPERTVVAHPFNPVYLIPLVEVAAGREERSGYRRVGQAILRPRRKIRRDLQGSRVRFPREPVADSAVAGGALHARGRRGDGRGPGPMHFRGTGFALGHHGTIPDVPSGWR